MKYRIVECKLETGNKYYKIEKRGLFGWCDYLVACEELHTIAYYVDTIEYEVWGFDSLEDAERGLKHFREMKTYRGKKLYPCILYDGTLGYYCSWGSEGTSFGRHYRITGSEENCREMIDSRFEMKDNLSYYKVSKEIDL